jgi:hypothetical protein
MLPSVRWRRLRSSSFRGLWTGRRLRREAIAIVQWRPYEIGCKALVDVAIVVAAAALMLSIASLLLGAGNARRLNRFVVAPPNMARPQGLAIGETLPDAVRDVLAKEPGAKFRDGRFLLVVVTGTCPACRQLAGDLNHRQAQFSQLPLVVVDSGNVGGPEFHELLEFPVPILRDGHQILQRAMKAEVVPFSFLIANQRIVGHTVGDSLARLLDG